MRSGVGALRRRGAGRSSRRPSRVLARHGMALLGAHPGNPRQLTMDKTKLTDARSPDPAREPLLLRPAEAARFLAISPRKLWELTNCHEVPAIRIGRALRYPTDELRAWVAGRSGRRS